MQDKLAVTIGCNISSLYYDNYFSSETKCLNKKIATCGFYEEYAKPEKHPDGYLIFQNDDFLRGASGIKNFLYFIFRPQPTFQKFDFTTSL